MSVWVCDRDRDRDATLPHIAFPPFQLRDYEGHRAYFYFTEYKRGRGFQDAGNQDIQNFKKLSPGLGAEISEEERYYRRQSISKMCEEFRNIVADIAGWHRGQEGESGDDSARPHLSPILLSHIPASSDDDRFSLLVRCILRENPETENVRYVPELFLRQNAESYSRGDERRGDAEYRKFLALLSINDSDIDAIENCNTIILVDDVITSGLQFRACCERLLERNADIQIFGAFYAKTTAS